MHGSTHRIFTTHAGNLPPPFLVLKMLNCIDSVRTVLQGQIEEGLDIFDQRELTKVISKSMVTMPTLVAMTRE
jgi:hypothetical protein